MVNHFKYSCILILLSFTAPLHSQNYHAIQGSSYAGSLGVSNNPAAISNTPYKWDVTILGGQLKYSTNIVTIYKYSLISKASRSEYLINSGIYQRYGLMNMNLKLVNARYTLSRKHAVAAGINLRSYTQVVPSDYFFLDTVKSPNSFLRINNPATLYQFNGVHSSWVEVFGTYARTLYEGGSGRLNLGLTLKVMRGISGAFSTIENAGATPEGQGRPYVLTSGAAQIGYSSTYDTWKGNSSTTSNMQNFFSHSRGGFAFDIGAEYLIKSGAIATFNDPVDYYGYEWKIGLSVLDIGKNNFTYGVYSSAYSDPIPISDAALQRKFRSIRSLPQLTDSLSTIANNVSSLSGGFTVATPARMVLNIDRYLSGNFYINADLSLNFPALHPVTEVRANEFNLFSVTPRWETNRLGFYLPILYNTKKRVWVGGAVKAGPLLIGIHNWGNIFSSKKMQRGGGYFAIIVRPGQFFDGPGEKTFECPEPF